jgi:hypothetical protein
LFCSTRKGEDFSFDSSRRNEEGEAREAGEVRGEGKGLSAPFRLVNRLPSDAPSIVVDGREGVKRGGDVGGRPCHHSTGGRVAGVGELSGLALIRPAGGVDLQSALSGRSGGEEESGEKGGRGERRHAELLFGRNECACTV